MHSETGAEPTLKTITGQLAQGTTGPAPAIECWIPAQIQDGIGLVIFPGGGYAHLAEHEGKGYAQYFSQRGIACFVVRYRLGPEGFRHPAMLEDGLAALATIRASAASFGLNPGRIGVMGSSAGGHLAAHTLVGWPSYTGPMSLRPDFGILCYPVVTSTGEFSHKGSFNNLLGPDASPALRETVSCERLVTRDTPPCFIWHTGEDPGVPVENSLLFASALRRNGVPFELHIYAKGRHGLGLNAPFPWGEACLRWLKEWSSTPPVLT
jgi:acetyl esterase/lipase